MPTYEYECSSCRHAWDLFQSIKADPERKCPKCGRTTARRKIGIGAAILSGGRSADAAEPAGAAGAAGATSAAKDAAAKPSTDAGTTTGTAAGAAPSAPSAPAPAAQAKDEGKLNSTHPARDGRGAGNLRDAIARQRSGGAGTSARPGAKKAAKPPTSPRRGSK